MSLLAALLANINYRAIHCEVLSYFEAQGFGDTNSGSCQKCVEHAIAPFRGGQDGFNLHRFEGRGVLIAPFYRWQADVFSPIDAEIAVCPCGLSLWRKPPTQSGNSY